MAHQARTGYTVARCLILGLRSIVEVLVVNNSPKSLMYV